MPKKNLKPIIFLASQSARRRQILKQMNIQFRVIPSTYRERMSKRGSGRTLVRAHARGKLRHARAPEKAQYILAADTVVTQGKRIFGKPKSVREAGGMIRCLSGRGRPHFVYTGVALRDKLRRKTVTGVARTKVYFKKLTEKQISDYVKKIKPLDKAGAYAIQKGPRIVRKIEGSYSNVVGLPKEMLRRMMKRLKVKGF